MSPCGERKSPSSCDGETWGSNFGTTLDIVVPGIFIPTTDRTGSAGYVSGDYYMSFGGTSAACPHVAATAALILSENPLLTQNKSQTSLKAQRKKLVIIAIHQQAEDQMARGIKRWDTVY